MRTRAQIKKTIRALERVWLKLPYYRLGQLVFNAASHNTESHQDVFYIEDRELVAALKKHCKQYEASWIEAKKKTKKRNRPTSKSLEKFLSGYKFPECLMPGGGETGHGETKSSKTRRRRK